MAALLKKRALAEFTQVVQEEPPKPPIKKLRLTYTPPKSEEPPINLKECTSPTEILDQLYKLDSSLPLGTEAAETILSQMKAYYYPEQDEAIRSAIIMLMGKLGKLPNVQSTYLCDDITQWLKTEKSHKLSAQMFYTLTEISKSLPYDTALHQKMISLAIKHLRDSSHLVRCKCLDLIGVLASPDHDLGASPARKETLQSVVETFTNDNDPRVRSSAFAVMLSWHERGYPVHSAAYKPACDALTDDYEGVRVSAARLVWVLAQLHSDSPVRVSDTSTEEIRLLDHGFAKICNMVNDICMSVRATAAGLLGSLHAVSPRFLEQTLDKKLMSNMRRKTSAHQRNREHYESGEWATGQKWADDAPKEDVDPDSVSVIGSGACGAFVHGLEDEFLEVRHAAIDSICELSVQHPPFASLAQDFLVDMLNDEIDTVRLNAIHSLRKMSRHIVLREDQLDGVLGVLKDFSFDIRESLRGMFSEVRLGTKACLNSCVLALLDNMRRYPVDRENIWDCMRHLGKHHAFLVMAMAPELMSCHPYFESIEPDVDDPSYVSILMLVFNATTQCPTMAGLFPEHATRHYNYLRDTLPGLVPKLRLHTDISSQTHPRTLTASPTATNAAHFLSDTLTRLQSLVTMDTAGAQKLLEFGIRDLRCVEDLDARLAATAKCHEMYLRCQSIVLQLIASYSEGAIVTADNMEDSVIMANIRQVYRLTTSLLHSFLGLGAAQRSRVSQLRLRAETLHLLLLLQTGQATKSACVDYLQIVTALQRSRPADTDRFSAAILAALPRLEACDLAVYLPVLESALGLHGPLAPLLARGEDTVQRLSAEICEPGGAAQGDKAARFVAGLTLAVPVVAEVLANPERIRDVHIRLSYPDHRTEYAAPKAADFRQLGALRHRLVTNVLLSHTKWSEPCSVELCVVLRHRAGHSIRGPTSAHRPPPHAYIELSPPVTVLVAPSGEKR